MLHVAGDRGHLLYCSSSLDPSETNGQTLEKSPTPAVQGLRPNEQHPSPSRYLFTQAQVHLHRRHQRDREIILDALDGSTFGPIGRQRVRMANCALSPLFVLKADGRVGLAPGFCRCRMCPTCQARRGRDLTHRIHAIVKTMDAPRFVTLTLRSTDESLKHTLDRLYAAFKELRRSKFWKAHVRGGVAVAEVTRPPDTGLWHPHIHVITDGQFMPQAALSAEWARVTGGSMIVDIRAVHDRRTAAHYVAAYVSKPTALTSWPPHAINEFAYASHGRRLIIPFGSCHRIRVPEDECETRVAIVEPLASAAALHRARNRGCLAAGLALDLLSRVGGAAASAAGVARRPGLPALPALDPHEWDWLAEALRFVGSADSAPDDDACPFADAATIAASPPDARPGTVRPPGTTTTAERVDDFAAPALT